MQEMQFMDESQVDAWRLKQEDADGNSVACIRPHFLNSSVPTLSYKQ